MRIAHLPGSGGAPGERRGVRGVHGEHTPIGEDGMVDISPTARLFIQEADIMVALYRGLRELLAADATAKEPLQAIG